MKATRLLLALSLLSILLSGCGGGSHNGASLQTNGKATFTVHWPTRTSRLIPVASNSILVTVLRNGATVGTKLLVRPVDPPFDTTASFDPLPIGNLQVTAKAFPAADGTGVAQASGAATLTVLANQNAALSLTMGTTITKVVVSPNPNIIDYSGTRNGGPSVTLTASAMDIDNNLVLTSGDTFTWGTNNSKIASIVPNKDMAVVTGAGIGETQVTAAETESNIGGQAKVNVHGFGLAQKSFGKFRADQQNTGSVPFRSNVGIQNGSLFLSWCFSTGGQIEASPVIDFDGTVYIGSSDGNLYAFAADGTSPKWTAQIGGRLKSSAAIGSDGTVYIASTSGQLAALDPKDGSFKWQVGYGGASFTSSPNIGADGTLYTGSQDGNVFATDGSNGNIKWSAFTGGGVESSPALSLDLKTLFVGSGDRRMHALNVSDGTEKWTFSTGGAIQSSPAVGNVVSANGGVTTEVLFFGSNDGKCYALVAADGSQFWKSPVITDGAITSSPTLTKIQFSTNSIPVVVFGSTDTFVYAVNATTGNGIGERLPLTGGVNSSAVADRNGRLFIGSDDLTLYRLNLTINGLFHAGTYKTGGSISSSPAIGPNGNVYVGSSDAKLYSFGPIL